jgi:hypothetical protein
MASDLYLIAHKVRGQPAFDIAEQMEVEGETFWMIPTSGHRAYPYFMERLDLLIDWEMARIHGRVVGEMPPDLIDHYNVDAAPRPNQFAKLLAILPPPSQERTMKRRF